MKIKFLISISIILSFSFVSIYIPQSTSENPIPVFYINLLSPNTIPERNQWAALMEDQFPKIGIGISFHESTGWGDIIPRLWSYPVGEEGYYDHIPTYEEGGYDIFFVGFTWFFDWEPLGLFDTDSIVPAGDNFYQYSNPTFDSKLDIYCTEIDEIEHIAIGKELQAILYEDLPAISIVYPCELFGLANSISGIDTQLVIMGNHRAENWRNSMKNNITYALPAEFSEHTIFVQESYYDTLWMSCVYYGLFERNQSDHLMEPVIAQSYTVSDDNLSFTVDINPNAYFSNGDPVTAYDVDYSYELYMTPAVGSRHYSYLTTYFENNDSIAALDADTVQFNLSRPYSLALNLLSLDIINKNLVLNFIDANGYDMWVLDQALVTSCGPFMLDVNDYNEETSIVTLYPNPYWALTNDDLLDALFFIYVGDKETAINSLASGAVDVIDSRYKALESDYEGVDANLVFTKSLIEQEMAINMLHPIIGTGELTPLGTAEAANYVRKAISHIVPREYIVNEILGGLGLQGVTPMPDGCIGFDDSLQPYVYDIDIARQYMEQAGYNLEYETTTETTPTETTPTETTPTETTPTETTPTETTPTETTPTETTPTETTPTETTPTETTPGDTTTSQTSTFSLGSRWVFSVLLFSLLSLSMVYIQRRK